MKKQLLTGAFVLASFFMAQAQELSAVNFDELTVGNVGTDVTGANPGQGDFYNQISNGAEGTTTTNMDNSVFQIFAQDADHVRSLKVTGPNGNAGGAFLWQDGLADAWADRTTGNDIIQVQFDYYTGTVGSSLNKFQVVIYNEDYSITLAGLQIDGGTLELRGLAHYTSTPGTGTYNFGLGSEDAPEVILPENTWVTVAFAYNKTTGVVAWAGPGVVDGAGVQGVAAGEDPAEVDFSVLSGSTQTVENTASSVGIFDNLNVTAFGGTAGVKDNLVSSLNVFPNPANDVVTITNNENILLSGVVVTDLNGRTVKTVKFAGVTEAQVNVSDLASGIYMMTISSDKGATTKKIVKN